MTLIITMVLYKYMKYKCNTIYATSQEFVDTFSCNGFLFYINDYLHCRFTLKASKL